MSDRIAVMNRGRIEQCAGPEDVYERPTTTFVAGFIGVSNLMPGEVDPVQRRRHPGHASTPGSRSRRRRTASSTGERCHAVVRPEKLVISSDRNGSRPRRPGQLAEGRRSGRELGLPRHGDPDRRQARRRRADDRAGPERRRGRARRGCRAAAPTSASPGRPSTSTWSASPRTRWRRRDHGGRMSMSPPASAACARLAPGGGRGARRAGLRRLRAGGDRRPADRRRADRRRLGQAVGRADDLQLAALHRQGDDRRLRGRDRGHGQVHRGRQRQRRVLRQGPAAARPGRVRRALDLRRHRLDGEQDARARLPAELRQDGDAQQLQEPRPEPRRTRPSTPTATSRCRGRRA